MQGERKGVSDSPYDAVERLRLEKRKRLLSRRQYDRVFGAANLDLPRGRVRALVVRNNCEFGRLGLVISKRALRSAVHRNLAKRVIRESFRQSQHRLQGLDVVVIVRGRGGGGAADPVLLRKELGEVLDRVWCDVQRWMT